MQGPLRGERSSKLVRYAGRSSSSVIPFKITFSCRGERPFARRGGRPLTGQSRRQKVFGLLTQANRIRQGSALAVHRPKIRERAPVSLYFRLVDTPHRKRSPPLKRGFKIKSIKNSFPSKVISPPSWKIVASSMMQVARRSQTSI